MVKRKTQRGGALPAVAAALGTVHTLAQKYKPVSALDDFLTSRGLKSDGKSLSGKIANAALSVGRSLGYGAMYSQVSLQHPRQGQNGVKSGSGKGKRKMIKV